MPRTPHELSQQLTTVEAFVAGQHLLVMTPVNKHHLVVDLIDEHVRVAYVAVAYVSLMRDLYGLEGRLEL